MLRQRTLNVSRNALRLPVIRSSPLWIGSLVERRRRDDAQCPADATSTEMGCIIRSGCEDRHDERNLVKTAPAGTVLNYLAHVTGARAFPTGQAPLLHVHVFPASEYGRRPDRFSRITSGGRRRASTTRGCTRAPRCDGEEIRS